ncbi:MAG: hypothetical protein ACLUAR_14570 [Pilosibacter sp.]
MNLELYLEQMKELVNIDSGSGNVAGINRVADKLAGWYQEIGWNVERIPADGGRQVLLITNHVSEHWRCDVYRSYGYGISGRDGREKTISDRRRKLLRSGCW